MGMVKRAVFALLHPFLRVYIKLRFGDYWGLKEYLQRRPSPLLKLAYEKYFMKYGSYVGVDSKIAGRPYFPHGCVGVFISNDAVIGRDAVIFQQVTIGSNTLPDSKRPGSPTVGDGAYIGAGAKLIGGITVGDHCRIGGPVRPHPDRPEGKAGQHLPGEDQRGKLRQPGRAAGPGDKIGKGRGAETRRGR